MTTDESLKAALEASLAPRTPEVYGSATAKALGKYVEDKVLAGVWPAPESVPIITLNGVRHYLIEGKPLVSVTAVLKILGLSTEALIQWSAREERKACLEAARMLYHEKPWALVRNGDAFTRILEGRIGPAKAHQRLLNKAADIGTQAHQAVQSWLGGLISGSEAQPPSGLPDEALVAYMSFQDWWRGSGLTPVRLEQPVWDSDWGYAGTIDVVASHPERGPGIVDLKTSRYIYEEHHLQVAAYLRAGRTWADLRWGSIVRLPKSIADPSFEVKELGQLHKRALSELELVTVFHSALVAWRILKGTEEEA